jgi:hypothetical protein
MPETHYQQLLPKKLRPKPIDLMGQCTKCCDLFTVTAFLVPGSGGGQATVSETASLKWVYQRKAEQNTKEDHTGPTLVHKCGGKVKIYGHSYPQEQQSENRTDTGGGTGSSTLPRYVLPSETRRYVSSRTTPQTVGER